MCEDGLSIDSTVTQPQEESTLSDNLRRSRALRDALRQAYPVPPPGNCARPVPTLAALLSGIVGGKSPHLPPIAPTGPAGTKPESRGTRCARWLDNDRIVAERDGVP